MSEFAAAAGGVARGAESSSVERTLRCRHAADRVACFPLIELALELYAYGGPDMRAEAEALSALLGDFAERMRRT